MWLFWGLTLLVLLALALQRPSGAQGWILFWVSIFFQGVALPVLAFVSNKQGDRMERVLRETHDSVLTELSEIKAMHAAQTEELATLRAINQRLSEKHERLVEGLERVTNPRVPGGRL